MRKIWTSDDITFFHSIEEGTGHRERCWDDMEKIVAVENFALRLLFIKCQNDVKIKKFEMDSTCKLER